MNSQFNRFNSKRQPQLLSWLRLVRLPNLFTAIGDPLAGLCIASFTTNIPFTFWQFIFMPLCGALMYAFGIILNDWKDIPEDRRHNPDRPLAAGQIAPSAALLAGICILLAALLTAFIAGRATLLIAIILAIAIIAYNNMLKQYAGHGAICMGLCRALNLLLGASAIQLTPDIVLPAIMVFAYVMYVTVLARSENHKVQIPDKNVFYPALIYTVGWLLAVFVGIRQFTAAALLPSALCAFAAVFSAFLSAARIYNRSIRPKEAHAFIGRLITGMIPMQTSFIVLALPEHAWIPVSAGVALWFFTAILGKLFPQS